MDIETLAREAIDSAFKIHRELGSGLFESVYEAVLAKSLDQKGIRVERQKVISIAYEGMTFDEGFRADLLIEESLLVELKSVEKLAPIHGKQVLTYLRLMRLPLGLLINFGAATFREGVQRIVNNHTNFASSRLRLHE
jgi:iron complex transport system substrate-binding protein